MKNKIREIFEKWFWTMLVTTLIGGIVFFVGAAGYQFYKVLTLFINNVWFGIVGAAVIIIPIVLVILDEFGILRIK